jgi:hypothetical protein
VAARGSCVTRGPAAGGHGNGSSHGEPERCDSDMTPLIRQDGPAAREYARDGRPDTDPAVRPGTAPAGQAMRPRLRRPRVPPLSGGTGSHGSGAAHAFTIATAPAAICAVIPETETAVQSQPNWRRPGHRPACVPGLLGWDTAGVDISLAGGSRLPAIVRPAGEVKISMRPVNLTGQLGPRAEEIPPSSPDGSSPEKAGATGAVRTSNWTASKHCCRSSDSSNGA